MSRLVTILAIPSLINDEDSLRIGSRRRIFAQQLEPLSLDLALILVRLREKPLELLNSWSLGSYNWLGVGQACSRFMPLGWQQETFDVAATSLSLIALPKEGINMLGILFQRGWR